MRNIEHFSPRDWMQLLPLRHALRQLRNDAWLAAYLQRRPAQLAAFLAGCARYADRNVALVIAFEQPWALGWLLDMAARHLDDTAALVFDNSRSAEARARIERVCGERDAPYLALPLNRTRHVNRSHGMAMSWVYRHVVREIAPRLFAFLDHDLIPIRKLSLAERLSEQAFFCLQVSSLANAPSSVQIVDDRWLHIGGISDNGNFDAKSEFCKRLAQGFDAGLDWPRIRSAGLEGALDRLPDRLPVRSTSA